MWFERIYTVMTYLLVGTGFVVLFLLGELSVTFWFILLFLMIGSGICFIYNALSNVSFWNVVLVVVLLCLIFLVYFIGDWLMSAIYFCFFMVVAKLY